MTKAATPMTNRKLRIFWRGVLLYLLAAGILPFLISKKFEAAYAFPAAFFLLGPFSFFIYEFKFLSGFLAFSLPILILAFLAVICAHPILKTILWVCAAPIWLLAGTAVWGIPV